MSSKLVKVTVGDLRQAINEVLAEAPEAQTVPKRGDIWVDVGNRKVYDDEIIAAGDVATAKQSVFDKYEFDFDDNGNVKGPKPGEPGVVSKLLGCCT